MTDSVKKKRKRRSSLLWKHIVVIFVALIIGFAAFFALSPLFRYVIEREYMTEDKEQARVEQLLTNFKNYVEQNQISSTDMEAIYDWVKSNDNFKLIMLEGVESDTVPDTQKYDYSVEVNFTDKSVLVAVQDYSEVLFLLGDVLAVGVSIVLFILVVIVYYQAEISRIMRLSRDVKAIAGGDLQGRIGKMGNDEIAQLADHVDGMRDSILQKMEEKEQAWRANQDLITSISHDIRTPLTALLGYLELLEMQDANLTEEQKKYLEVASENAGRIKRQSDDLFNYFLAYGHRTEEISMQSYRADVLFEQLLGERFTPADLANQSFVCNISAELAGVRVQTNVDYLVRVLDNLYSNIVKYADRDYPVELNVALRGKMAVITVQNRIAPVTPGVESTKLGLLTCESIMERLHGSFRTENDGNTFTVVMALPIKETK